MYRTSFQDFIKKEGLVDIPKPDAKTLDIWRTKYEKCHGNKPSRELMLQAYLFDVAFVIGRFRKDTQSTIEGMYLEKDGSFSPELSTSTRQGLSNAISYIRYGLHSPRYKEAKRFEKEHARRVAEYGQAENPLQLP